MCITLPQLYNHALLCFDLSHKILKYWEKKNFFLVVLLFMLVLSHKVSYPGLIYLHYLMYVAFIRFMFKMLIWI